MTNVISALVAPLDAMVADVRRGLSRPQKELPPKYFYDRRGSELFEEITRLPEYYLTRAERRLLAEWMPCLVQLHRPTTLVELGAGSGEKTRIILRAMRDARRDLAVRYVPVDVSAEFLEESSRRVRRDLPWLAVAPVVADFSERWTLPVEREGPTLFAFLGSTIGNLDRPGAIRLMRAVREAMRHDDRFLLGADLHTKDAARIVSAYNDAAGVTAEFNRNVMRVLNRELGAGFDVGAFAHHAPWVEHERRIEMHLVARAALAVDVPFVGGVSFEAGESIRTEVCCKYDRATLEAMLREAGLAIETWRVDAPDQFAIVMAAPQEGA